MTNVQQLTQKFVSDLSAAVRQEVLEDLTRKLSGPGATRVAQSMTAPITPTLMQRAVRRIGSGKKARGEKRSPVQIAKTVEAIAAHIAKTPGVSSEMIQGQLNLGRNEVALPIAKLLASKRIRKTGEKRATRYYPAKVATKKN